MARIMPRKDLGVVIGGGAAVGAGAGAGVGGGGVGIVGVLGAALGLFLGIF